MLGGGAFYCFELEPDWLELEQVEIVLAGLPARLDGLRIAHLSDFHAGPDLPTARLERAIRMVEELEPDLVVMTGDWVTYDPADAGPVAQALARLTPSLGIFATLGNHDHWTHAGRVAGKVEAAGITLLLNRHVPISVRGETLWLAGVDDIWEEQHDLDRALAGIPQDVPILLLAHEPDYADTVAADGRVALQLSGHSHGGQVYVPVLGSPVVPYLGSKYVRGLYRVDNKMWLYTNRGIGTIRPALRFACRPEVTLITLRSDHGQAGL